MKRRKPELDAPRSELDGVVADVAELVALRRSARRVDLCVPQRARAALAGSHRSAQRGRGVEFDEVRAYQAGDDVRSIDWRVSARRGRTYSKLFHEERERPVMLLVDLRAPMRFGSRGAFKSVVAARAAACLAWAAVEQGDRIGGVVLSESGAREVKPGRRKARLLGLLEGMAQATGETLDSGGASLGRALARLRRRTCSGARVVVLSDFHDMDDEARLHLAQLARVAEVSCVHVHDPLESAAPPPGRYLVSDGERVASLAAGDRAWRERYAAHFEARRAELEDFCRRRGVDLLTLRTDDDVERVLAARRKRPARRPRKTQRSNPR